MTAPTPCLLLVHGFPLHGRMWAHQAGQFPGWTTLTPDLPGFGSDGSVGRTMADYAAAMEATVPADSGPVVVAGLSMGGYVVFEMLRRGRVRCDGVVLMDTRAEPDSAEGKAGRDAMIRTARDRGVGAVAEAMLPKVLGATSLASRPALVAEVRALMGEVPLAGVVGGLQAMRDRSDSRDLLPSLPVPTLVLVGKEDTITPLAVMGPLAEALPKGRLEVVAGAGHLPPLERPEAVNRVLGAFLAGVL